MEANYTQPTQGNKTPLRIEHEITRPYFERLDDFMREKRDELEQLYLSMEDPLFKDILHRIRKREPLTEDGLTVIRPYEDERWMSHSFSLDTVYKIAAKAIVSGLDNALRYASGDTSQERKISSIVLRLTATYDKQTQPTTPEIPEPETNDDDLPTADFEEWFRELHDE